MIGDETGVTVDKEQDDIEPEQIAVVGLAGRYPESPNVDAFWQNLRSGTDCLRTFSPEEMDALGIPSSFYERDNFVPRGSLLPDATRFDAAFFGFTPREAQIMDPQSRIFLETCYEALEHSGYDPYRYDEAIGVFAGSNPNDYATLLGVTDPSDSLSAFDRLIGSDKDFLATRVSHRLNLRGPALTLQTACSTSLVAIHLAVQSLLNYECSMALAGGVTVNLRQGVGYFHQSGMILSPRGTCRAFDADAEGTTLGQGCGVVVLKRLSEAIDDGDTIWAVVKATAINNDGSSKISYTAPSEDGQAEVIALAQELAGVESDSITYIEAHGTGTKLGDPVEIAALTRAFAAGTHRRQYCAIGSVKSNFGHTDAAAGVTGFMKAVLSVANAEIPPSLHFDEPNPSIGFEQTPFFVNDRLREWDASPYPRRAGVSAFGIGGTNAHAIIEEAPSTATPVSETAPIQLFLASGRTAAAADASISEVANVVASNPALNLADAAFTLREGRAQHPHRRAIAVKTDGDIAVSVRDSLENALVAATATSASPRLVWLYTGQGSQYPGMAADLYTSETSFRSAIDECAALFDPLLGADLRSLMFDSESADAAEQLTQTRTTQPALFSVEYAMSAQLRDWGLVPDAVIGHSIGEYAAAVEAGVLSLADAAHLVAARGRFMQAMQPGSMASIGLDASEIADALSGDVELAAENSQGLSVVSGPTDQIQALVERLADEDVSASMLQTSHAFHSSMMDGAVEQFEHEASGVEFRGPTIPMASNVTGDWLRPEEATDPGFWASQIRNPVLFAACVRRVADGQDCAFVELGPGRALTTMVSRNSAVDSRTTTVVSTIRHPRIERHDQLVAHEAVLKLWCGGVDIDWDALGQTKGRRVPMPTYPFERTEHWLPGRRHQLALPFFGELDTTKASVASRNSEDQWLYVPSFTREPARPTVVRGNGPIVVLLPEAPGADDWLDELRLAFESVVVVRAGAEYIRTNDDFVVRAGIDDDVAEVFETLAKEGRSIDLVIHGWLLDAPPADDLPSLELALSLGVHTANQLGRSVSRLGQEARIKFVTQGARNVLGHESVRPEVAAVEGPAKVIPLEYPGIASQVIDLDSGLQEPGVREALLGELNTDCIDPIVAIRHGMRWIPSFAQLNTPAEIGSLAERLRPGGHYLLVGGLGGVGLSIGRFLAEEYRSKLAFTSRSGRPRSSDDASPEQRRRIEILDEIEHLSGGMTVHAADAASLPDMERAVAEAEAENGPIDGVIVAAGVADYGGTIHRRTRETMIDSMASKVHGSLVLEMIFGARDVDFLLLSSSVAATLYHNRFAQVGYVTGNAFVEAFAQRGQQRGLPTLAVAWDDWLEIGMSVRAAQDFSAAYGSEVTLMDELNSFTPAEGVRTFTRALAAGEPLVVVSPTDLSQRVRDDVHQTSPFLEQAVGEDRNASIDPGGSVESALGHVWCDLLGFDEVAPEDDFFELGGDSLQAARMGDRLSRTFGVDVPLSLLFDHPRLADMASALKALTETGGEGTTHEIDSGMVPLSPAQLRFLSRNSENPNHFNVSALLEPSSPIDPAAFHTVVRGLVEMHPALRTRFPADAGEAQEILDAEAGWGGLEEITIANPSDVSSVCQVIQEGLNLVTGPVFRSALISIEETGEQRVFVAIHHMVSDRVSLLLLLDALNETYGPIAAGEEAASVGPTAAFGTWIAALHDYVDSDAGKSAASNWLELPWHSVGVIPVDNAGAANINSDAHAVRVRLTGATANAALRHSSGRADELVLLALGQEIAAWSDSRSGLVDTLNHGRRFLDVDVARTMGFFLTYSPVLIPAADPTVEVAKAVETLRARSAEAWTFDPIRLYSSNESTRTAIQALPRAHVLFNFVGREFGVDGEQFLRPSDEDRGADSDPAGNRAHTIAVMAEITSDDEIELAFVYSTALHNRSTIETLASSVRSRIERFVGAEGE